MKKFIAIILLLLTSTSLAQTHTPSVVSMDKFGVVDFDAEFIAINPAPVYITNGTPFDDEFKIIGAHIPNIQLVLDPGVEYTYTMQGRADDPLNPQRIEIVGVLIVPVMTRSELIRHHWANIGLAESYFKTHPATYEEMDAALNEPPSP